MGLIGMVNLIVNEWRNLKWSELKFSHLNEAILVVGVFVAVLLVVIVLRFSKQNIPGRRTIVLPGILTNFRKSPFSFLRHLPVTLFWVGLPFFLVAFADPYVSFVKENTTYLGRRIVLVIDASGSMDGKFETKQLKAKDKKTFYTAVTAAEYFMELRIKGKYQDLIGLLEFGDESYVITPFTNDYQNILMSIKLIGEPEERARFTDKNTFIIKAINQSTELFKMFNFLNTSGNLMILISDGEDNQVMLGNRSLNDIVAEARQNKIPIYFIRTNYDKLFGAGNFSVPDELWKRAVEGTGGKFYVGANEDMIINALNDINSLTSGVINVNRYIIRQPRFVLFILIASILWTLALFLYFLLKSFRKFP